MRNLSGKSFRENQNTFYGQKLYSEKRAVYGIMWEKLRYSGAGHRWQFGARETHAGYLRLQTQTQNM